jgi:hypothetical protein
VVINTTNEAADLGTAAHEALARFVEVGTYDLDTVPALARRYSVDETELRILIVSGIKLWQQVEDSFPDAQTEVELSTTDARWELTGHADVLSLGMTTAHVADHKTGRVDSDYREQLIGYAALALMQDSALESATATVLWVREQEAEHYTMQRSELGAWLERLESEIVDWSGEYRPGKHCEYCHRSHECVAANALARRDVAALSNLDLDDRALDALTPKQWIDLVEMAANVNKLSERVRGLAKTRVLQHGDISDGKRRLTIVTEERRSLDPLKAFPVLDEAGFEDEDKAAVITMSAAKAEDVVAKRAAKGKGAAAVRALREQLEAAGAIQTTEIQKLTQRRA